MKAKIITTAILSISTAIYNIINPVSALEYTTNYGNNFTIRPSINVSVSGDLVIDELVPGSSSDSDIIDVTVSSNNSTGYILSSTVGTSNSNYTDLRLNDYNENTHKFTNLDTRDNEVYWIGKLKDNRCWLLDNLRLGSNDHGILLTPQDTNIAEDWTLPRGITNNFTDPTIGQINATYSKETPTSYGMNIGKTGVYYNYCATSVGTYCSLYDQYGAAQTATDTKSLQHNFSVTLSGNFYDSTQYNSGKTAYYWASTYYDKYQMYTSRITASVIETSKYYRREGYSIRCVANNE